MPSSERSSIGLRAGLERLLVERLDAAARRPRSPAIRKVWPSFSSRRVARRGPAPASSTLGSLIAPPPPSRARSRAPSPSPSTARARRESSVSSGWKEQASTSPSRIATGWPSHSRQHLDPGAVRSIQGARMKTARIGSAPIAARTRGRPRSSAAGGRRRCGGPSASIRPRWSRVADDHPRAGAEDRPAGVGVGADRRLEPVALDRLRDRRALAAGDDEPVEAARARRASRTSTRVGAELAQHPHVGGEVALEARTPIRSGAPAPALTSRAAAAARPRRRAGRCRRRASARRGRSRRRATRSGSSKWVVASTIAFARPLGVLGLEDAGADEVALGAELHRQRGVGGGRDAAGAEERHRQPAALGDVADDLERRPQLLRLGRELLGVERCEAADPAGDLAQVADGLDDVAGAGLALGADHRRALADPAQRLAEVGGAADERDVEGELVDVVRLVGRASAPRTRRCSRPRAPAGPAPRRSGRSAPSP